MSPGLALSRPLGGSRVRWPAVMATSHRTLHHGDAEQRRRRPQRALLHPVRLPSPIGSLPRSSQTARHSLCRAVWRNPRVCPQPMCSWQRDSTACTGTLPHSGCVLRPERTFLTARLPAAPCGAPPPPDPHGLSLPHATAHTLASSSTTLLWWHAPCTSSQRESPLRNAAFILPYSYLPITHTRVTRYPASECEHAPRQPAALRAWFGNRKCRHQAELRVGLRASRIAGSRNIRLSSCGKL